MSRDPIIDEVRAVRDAIAREFNYDIEHLAESLRREQQQSDRKVVRLSPRKLPPVKKAS